MPSLRRPVRGVLPVDVAAALRGVGGLQHQAAALSLAFPDTWVLLPLFCLTWAWVLEQAVAVVMLVVWSFVLEKKHYGQSVKLGFFKTQAFRNSYRLQVVQLWRRVQSAGQSVW